MMKMPHRLLPRKMTSPTARVIASIWLCVGLVSGLVLHTSFREVACDRQFRAALIERAQLSEEADAYEKLQDEAVASWVKDFSHPPPGADVYGNARMEWLQGVSTRAMLRFDELGKKRDEAMALRRERSYPRLSCGK